MITSIIILTYNKLNYTKQCIESIRNNTAKGSYELIIVDNCSNDGTKEWLKSQKDIITIFNNENLGFPRGCNQGIKISNGENILLLNNDVIVTQNWLANLIKCLYSSYDIGAVSSVSNSCSYYQAIETEYRSIEEMQSFARKYNISNSDKWEERLKLIGFCMLIRKEVIKKIGLLDEEFSPGNYEDDDYSIRIRRAGYKLMLCKDTFIHHYGGTTFKENKEYSKLLSNNEEKFKKKWGFTSAKNMEINKNLVDLIEKSSDEKFKVLQIGCGCGATLLYLKDKFKNAELYGVGVNREALSQADFLLDSFNQDIYNIYKICEHFSNIKVDYIFINHIFLDRKENDEVLYKLGELLNCNGKIFVELKPVAKDGRHNLTSQKLVESFIRKGYKNIKGTIVKYENRVKEYIFSAENTKTELKGEENLLEAPEKKKNICELQRKLKFLLRRIENDIEVEESREEVYELLKASHINLEDILFSTAKDIIKKDEVLNSVAAKFYEKGLYDNVIPLFQAAYEYNPKNTDVIYNLAYFLYELGEKKLSLTYFEKIKGTNTEVDKFIKELKENVDGTNSNSNLYREPLVSILIPSYNRPKYIEIALESAINQTYKNIEIIISDDSDNDNVKNVIAKYLRKDNRIKYYKNTNRLGVFGNFKRCFQLAKGEFINYLIDDDLYSVNKIEKMMECYKNIEGVSLVTSYRQVIDENGKYLEPIFATKKLFNDMKTIDGKILKQFVAKTLYNLIGEPTTILFRKSDIDFNKFGVYGGYKYRNMTDIALWFQLLSKGKAVYIPEALSFFRIHSGQDQKNFVTGLHGVKEQFVLAKQCLKEGLYKNDNEYRKVLSQWIDNICLVKSIDDNYNKIIQENIELKELYDCFNEALKILFRIDE